MELLLEKDEQAISEALGDKAAIAFKTFVNNTKEAISDSRVRLSKVDKGAIAKELAHNDGFIEQLATKTNIAEVKAEIAEVKAEIAEVKVEIAEIRAEIAEVKAELKIDIAEIKTEIAEIRAEIVEVKAELKIDIAEIKTEIKYIKYIGIGFLILYAFDGNIGDAIKSFFG